MTLALSFFLACAPGTSALDVTVDGDYTANTKAVSEGSVEATAMLAFLNDPATTMTVLDYQVPLDKRAAGNLIGHRDGGDGASGTSDDDLFGTVAEVDAVRWVGVATIDRLAAYALALGYGLEDDDELGTWDGVTFTVAEAAATIAFVNDASESMLDDEVPLNSRAVASIMDARPLSTVAELSDLYYVGNSAMELLLDGAYNLGDDSWLNDDEDEEDLTCDATLADWDNSDAEDLTELLALSTTSDAPWAEVYAFQAEGCEDWETPGDSLTQAAFNASFWWSWGDVSSYIELGEWTAGGSAFASMLNTAMTVIDERTDEGSWDPSDAQELYDSRDSLVDSLLLGVSEYPHGYIEQTLYVDMLECSQEAVLLLDIENGQLLVIHEESHC
jgi:hypothetical protein